MYFYFRAINNPKKSKTPLVESIKFYPKTGQQPNTLSDDQNSHDVPSFYPG